MALPGYCAGRFRYADLGSVWQATDCSRQAVVLDVRGEPRPIVLTPPDRARFLAALRGEGDLEASPPGLRAAAMPRALLSAVLAGLLALGAGLEALILLGPSRLRYTVAPAEVSVRTLFARKRWPIAGLRARHHRPECGLRVAGTAMPGDYTGLFRCDGRFTRVYATDLSGGVLLESGARRVYLSPAHPAAFLAALRAAGAAIE
jgi:hypothetical protein